jgi:hypothetical protein
MGTKNHHMDINRLIQHLIRLIQLLRTILRLTTPPPPLIQQPPHIPPPATTLPQAIQRRIRQQHTLPQHTTQPHTLLSLTTHMAVMVPRLVDMTRMKKNV